MIIKCQFYNINSPLLLPYLSAVHISDLAGYHGSSAIQKDKFALCFEVQKLTVKYVSQ